MINSLLKCRNIKRLSGIDTIKEYDLMQHQFMVANLFQYFASKEDVSYGMSEFLIILRHDLVETETRCDLVYTVKNFSEKTKKAWKTIENEVLTKNKKLLPYLDENIKFVLSPLQFALFKACDLLDLWLFLKTEISLGNSSKEILKIENNCKVLINNLDFKFETIQKFIKNYKND